MSLTSRRALLALLAVVGLYTGGWAYAAPRNWYANFPGFGFRWLPQLGPYNTHLAKDTGAMFLALAVLALLTIGYARHTVVVQITASAWLVFNVLHCAFHLQHLHVYGTTDKVLNVVSLCLLVLVTTALFVPERRRGTRPTPTRVTSRD